MTPLQRWRSALGADRSDGTPRGGRARAAAYIITASEGGNHHLADLRSQPDKFDPHTRSRFLAGALVPGRLGQFRAAFPQLVSRARCARSFEQVDVILAPATPCPAIRIGQKHHHG